MTGARTAAPTITIETTAASTTSLERRKLCSRSLSRNAARRLRRALAMVPVREAALEGAVLSAASLIDLSRGPAQDADAWIDPHIHEVNDKVDEHEQERHQHEIGCHHGNVGVLHGLDEHQPHAGPLEHGLGNDGERDHGTELEADH